MNPLGPVAGDEPRAAIGVISTALQKYSERLIEDLGAPDSGCLITRGIKCPSSTQLFCALLIIGSAIGNVLALRITLLSECICETAK